MEDWEQFFVEKSRRRAEVERRERQRRTLLRMLAGVVLGTIIIGGFVALAISQPAL